VLDLISVRFLPEKQGNSDSNVDTLSVRVLDKFVIEIARDAALSYVVWRCKRI